MFRRSKLYFKNVQEIEIIFQKCSGDRNYIPKMFRRSKLHSKNVQEIETVSLAKFLIIPKLLRRSERA
jgi:hypothetical protein